MDLLVALAVVEGAVAGLVALNHQLFILKHLLVEDFCVSRLSSTLLFGIGLHTLTPRRISQGLGFSL